MERSVIRQDEDAAAVAAAQDIAVFRRFNTEDLGIGDSVIISIAGNDLIIFDDIECMISKYSSLINEMHSKTIVKKEGADKDRIDKKEINNVEQK